MIKLSEHFGYKKLIKFSLPVIIMFSLSSIYGVIDGLFVTNFVGKIPFASIGFILPFLFILDAIGLIFGTGGGALIAKTIGEKDREKANKIFSLIVYTSIISGIIFTIIGYIFLEPFAVLFGAHGELLEGVKTYGYIYLLGITASVLQLEFQSFFSTAAKPKMGLYITLIAGVTNIILDAIFIIVFKWGLQGVAIATVISKSIGGIIPIIYFSRKNKSLLRLGKTHFDGQVLLKSCTNGASEFIGNIAVAIIGMLYNMQLLKYAGENGVAAYAVLFNVSMIFMTMAMGYAAGVAPVISYHFGAGNHTEIKSLRKKSTNMIVCTSLLVFLLLQVFARNIVGLFVGYDPELFEMTLRGFRIGTISLLFSGFAIFNTAFFTALNDGFVSGFISFSRTFIFEISAILVLPIIFGLDGIWFSAVIAEILAICVAIIFLIAKRKKYKY